MKRLERVFDLLEHGFVAVRAHDRAAGAGERGGRADLAGPLDHPLVRFRQPADRLAEIEILIDREPQALGIAARIDARASTVKSASRAMVSITAGSPRLNRSRRLLWITSVGSLASVE